MPPVKSLTNRRATAAFPLSVRDALGARIVWIFAELKHAANVTATRRYTLETCSSSARML